MSKFTTVSGPVIGAAVMAIAFAAFFASDAPTAKSGSADRFRAASRQGRPLPRAH